MTNRGLRHTGLTVTTRHLVLPCGRQYSGKQTTVDKLVAIHKKVCPTCESAKVNEMQRVQTDGATGLIKE